MEQKLVLMQGVIKGIYYALSPALYQSARLDERPTLHPLSPALLRTRILEDVRSHPQSALADIVGRVGSDTATSTVQRAVYALVKSGELLASAGRH